MTATNVLTQALDSGNQLSVNSVSVPGGTLYTATVERAGFLETPALVFVPGSVPSPQRYLSLTLARSDLGVPLTVTPGTPTGAVGVTRVAGTSLQLVGEATSSSAKTNVALFEFDLPDSYVAGAAIPVTINAVVTGAGTLTGASTTMAVAAYSEINGVETALTVSAAQQIAKTTATNLAFTITGTGLAPGAHVAIELTMLVTSASGANTGAINSVIYQA